MLDSGGVVELCSRTPQIRALYAWLGSDPSFDAAGVGEPLNEMPGELEQARPLGLLHRLRRSHAYSRIASLVPRPVRTWGSQLAERKVRPADVCVDDVLRYLRPRQQEQTEALRALLRRNFPEWKTLYAVSETARSDTEITSRSPGPRLGGLLSVER